MLVIERGSWAGKRLDDLPTPCLLADVERLDHNLRLMANYFAKRPCKLRPHFKSHKCVTLAKRQLAAGSAAGITCAKLSEAEALVEGGVRDVLIANQVVGADKARRLAQLVGKATVRVAVDSEVNIRELAAAGVAAGVEIGCLVEVDIGMGRCGVHPPEAAPEMVRLLQQTRGVRFDGLQGYEGHAVALPDYGERKRIVTECIKLLLQVKDAVESEGLPVKITSAGGTGTYDITGNIEGIDEVQAGSYALMDSAYVRIRPEFQVALSVLATVISTPAPGRAVLDVGMKGVGAEFGPPSVADHPGAEIPRFRSEEHTVVGNLDVPAGGKVRLVPSHGCTTCNLHRRLVVHRRGIVQEVWPIEGSGCLE